MSNEYVEKIAGIIHSYLADGESIREQCPKIAGAVMRELRDALAAETSPRLRFIAGFHSMTVDEAWWDEAVRARAVEAWGPTSDRIDYIPGKETTGGGFAWDAADAVTLRKADPGEFARAFLSPSAVKSLTFFFSSYAATLENLAATQNRCKELLEENRRLRREFGDRGEMSEVAAAALDAPDRADRKHDAHCIDRRELYASPKKIQRVKDFLAQTKADLEEVRKRSYCSEHEYGRQDQRVVTIEALAFINDKADQ